MDKEGVRTANFLYELGYDKLERYDDKRMLELTNDYDVSPAEIAQDVFNIDRRNIYPRLQKENINRSYLWKEIELTHLYKTDIIKMIQNKEWSYDNEEKMIRYLMISNFKKSSSNTVEFIVIIHNYADENDFEATKLYIVLDDEIIRFLKKHGHFYIGQADYSRFKKILEEVEEYLSKDNLIPVGLSTNIDNLHTETKNIDLKDFRYLFGINHETEIVDKRFADENRFVERIKKYADNDNNVFINSKTPDGEDNPDYQFLANNASRSGGIGIEEFINSFGYNFIPGNEYYKIQFRKKSKFKLKQRIVTGNKVYIDSRDPFYYHLHSVASKRNQLLDDYILEEYGYIRLRKNECPSDYRPYNWAQEIEGLNHTSEDEMKAYIENQLDEEGIFYLGNNDKVYRNLYAYALNNDSSPLKLLKEWNIEYRWKTKEDEEQSEEELREELLKDIKDLDSTLREETVKQNKKVRNQELVKKLKLLYKYKCQICSADNYIPPIVNNEGDYYCEMHHIKPVKSFDDELSVHDESNVMIDHYQNCIIVCPHHHKVIHYEKGGYKSLEKKESKFYLLNEVGNRLPIATNYHLS